MARGLRALACAVGSALFFLPSLGHEFVWDDRVNVVLNPHLAGPWAPIVRWALTTPWEHQPSWGGQWIPLSWLSLALDRHLWGLRPLGYHLTNVLLHALAAGLFCLLAERLLRRALPARTVGVGAVVATLAWSLHPLRIESVAWVTERRDVLSGVFLLVTVLLYLRAVEGRRLRPSIFVLSFGTYVLALASKVSVIGLPLVLLILDAYPLMRLRGVWGRRIVEKIPYAALASGSTALTLIALHTTNSESPYPLLERVAMALYAVVFYLGKTVVPAALSVLYEAPLAINVWQARFLGSAVAVLIVTIGVLWFRSRWPAGVAVWLVYLVLLAPQSGLVHAGYALAADRYSYLPALAPALLIGALATISLRRRTMA